MYRRRRRRPRGQCHNFPVAKLGCVETTSIADTLLMANSFAAVVDGVMELEWRRRGGRTAADDPPPAATAWSPTECVCGRSNESSRGAEQHTLFRSVERAVEAPIYRESPSPIPGRGSKRERHECSSKSKVTPLPLPSHLASPVPLVLYPPENFPHSHREFSTQPPEIFC